MVVLRTFINYISFSSFFPTETPGAVIYFTSNGQKPDPYVRNSKTTIKYKGPFLLNDGKRAIKAMAISR